MRAPLASALAVVLMRGTLAFAQADPAAADPGLALRLDRSSLELRLAAQHLSGGYGDWREGAVVGTYSSGAHALRGELASMRRFGEAGNYAGVMDTLTLDPSWYATFAAGAGDGAFYLPRYRVDASINRKLLAARNLVLSIGAGQYRAPDGHLDRSITVGGQYYFAQPWVVQGEVRFGQSDPGSVRARQQRIALTYGREGELQVITRYGWGRESYLAIGPATSLVDFASHEANVQARYWFDRSHGVSVSGERYENPVYRRSGVVLGYFAQLR